ncbi:MAG: hypothetical protein EBY76_06185 [Betaproteobacteria bacterium]|nr:hypothetical protein [Betaproteobacteria bacterium]
MNRCIERFVSGLHRSLQSHPGTFAVLIPDQTDQDSLPPYDVLDDIIQRYMENNLSGDQLRPGGIDDAVIARVVRLIQINEYKRRQAAVGVRVTPRAWGRDWRYPITSGWR